jgi:zinc transporter 5/7
MADQEAGGGNSHSQSHDHHHDHGHGHDHDHSGHEHTRDEKCNGHHDNASEAAPKVTILGVIHVVAGPAADMDDVRDRVEQYFRSRGMDIVVHVEKEGDGRCWCGTGMKAMASPVRIK